MNKKIALISAAFVIFLIVPLFSKGALELDMGYGFLNPKDFNSQYLTDYMSINSIFTGAAATYAERMFDGTLYLKSFVNDSIDMKLALSIMDAGLYETLNTSPKITAKLNIPAVYAGIGFDLYRELNPRLSVFAGADAGVTCQIGFVSKIQLKLPPELDSSSYYFGPGIGYAINTKAGFQWMFTDFLGLTAYGGYRKGTLRTSFPDTAPFNTPEWLTKKTTIDISGPIAGAGLVLYSNEAQDKQEGPSQDKKPTARLHKFTAPGKPEFQKFCELYEGHNYFIPKFDTRLSLLVSTGSGKPKEIPKLAQVKNFANSQPDSAPKTLSFASLEKSPGASARATFLGKPEPDKLTMSVQSGPLTSAVKPDMLLAGAQAKTSAYTAPYAAAFIDAKGDKKRWFAFELNNAAGASDVIWQVSSAQFSGRKEGWKNPPALLNSGKVPVSAKEFQVDLSETNNSKFASLRKTFSSLERRKCVYIRAVPVDAFENPIGDPGQGTAVVLGGQKINVISQVPKFEVQTTMNLLGNYSGEFQDKPKHHDETTIDAKNSDCKKLFAISGVPAGNGRLVMQVSDKPFTQANDTIGAGTLLYEKTFDLPVSQDSLFSYFPLADYPCAVIIPFADFGKKPAEMQENEYIKYYVRGIYLKPGAAQGMTDGLLTDTTIINYGFGPAFKFAGPPPPKYITIGRSLPRIKMKGYTPAQWQAFDCFSHYVIYRAPKANEILCNWVNTESNEVLLPWVFQYNQAHYAKQGIYTAEQYEQIVIPRVLKPGMTVYFPPPTDEDKPWYQELYDGVVGFFKDLVNAAAALMNQISASYNNLKTGLINIVANLCPIDSLKGAFKTALEGLVDYGMVCVGVPPTLPNFDELSDMSLDYLAETALSEAGVPPNQLTQELTDKVKDGIKEQVHSAAAVGAPNPVSAAFLKLDPAYLYRPAYMDVEFTNDSDYPTVPGTFDINVTFEFDYYTMASGPYDPAGGIFFSYPNPYKVGSDAAITTSLDYQDHFLFGLNGYTVNYKNGGTAVYDVFDPSAANAVPVLLPHQTTTARIYLNPCTGGTFSHYVSGEGVTWDDFEVMYFGNGNKKFTNFFMTGDFPTPKEFEASQKIYNFEPNTEFIYNNYGSLADEAKLRPVSEGW